MSEPLSEQALNDAAEYGEWIRVRGWGYFGGAADIIAKLVAEVRRQNALLAPWHDERLLLPPEVTTYRPRTLK